MTDAPLIGAASSEHFSGGSSSSYAPPAALPVVPRLPPLPSDPAERERALERWASLLRDWQSSLEVASSSSSSSHASSRRVLSWPPGPFACLPLSPSDIPAGPPRSSLRVGYITWLLLLPTLLLNASAVLALHLSSPTLAPVGQIIWAFLVHLVLGSIASFAVYRLLFSALRKARPSLLREVSAMLVLELLAVLALLAGIPGSGSAGIWIAVEASRLPPPLPAAAVSLCAVASGAWLTQAVLLTVVLVRVRRHLGEIGRAQLHDAYLQFEEQNVGVFPEDADNGAVSEQKAKPSPPVSAPAVSSSVVSNDDFEEEDLAGSVHLDVIPLSAEDEEIFSPSSSLAKKTKKSKKHRKKTPKAQDAE